MNDLSAIVEPIREDMSARNAARDLALAHSRSLIRACAQTIRAAHREEFDTAAARLEEARQLAAELDAATRDKPDLYFAGYTQDGLKEYVEAHLVLAFLTDRPAPTPAELNVIGATYLRGMAEAASELRRRILDIIRQDQKLAEAERLLDVMDEIYTLLITFDFPDSVTYGLRRTTDALRAVLERTRGDLTMSLRQQRLQAAIQMLETGLDADQAG